MQAQQSLKQREDAWRPMFFAPAEWLPAAFPGVLGVAGDDHCSWAEHLYIAEDPIPFRAHPCPRPLPGPAQRRNFRGHSFASAHLSSEVARLVERNPALTSEEARVSLINTAGVRRVVL